MTLVLVAKTLPTVPQSFPVSSGAAANVDDAMLLLGLLLLQLLLPVLLEYLTFGRHAK